ncbi:PiggyBac transposable element-derived protein 4 [Trichinella papuae]|uniref:PiggyBac transposable element-derived protein 4 n=1 Tax=Trichinella papuae TaxID=268474 RepID=A0A0V1N1U8_9BILA|nr:PiggyBac transposable element-derived protein 4 [Trichinella papuae]
MCSDKESFRSKKDMKPTLSLANSKSTEIKEIGTTNFEILDSGETRSVKLSNTLYVPDLKSNLLSVGKITESGFKVTFQKDSAKITGQNLETETKKRHSSSESATEEVMYERTDLWISRDHVCSWNKQVPSRNVRTRAHNIYSRRQGPRSVARRAKTPFEIWSLFMTRDIIDGIALNTDIYILAKSGLNADEDEIKALLGLLPLAGVFHSNRLNLCDLHNTDSTDIEIFSSTMSLERLRFLLRCMRFDDHATRSERKLQDKLAPIQMVFDSFVRNCTENYMYYPHVTIDEVLVSFKGRCPFRAYIPSKAAEYGIKIFELSDLETYYVSKMEVYVGKQNEGPHQMDTSSKGFAVQLLEVEEASLWTTGSGGPRATTNGWIMHVTTQGTAKSQISTIRMAQMSWSSEREKLHRKMKMFLDQSVSPLLSMMALDQMIHRKDGQKEGAMEGLRALSDGLTAAGRGHRHQPGETVDPAKADQRFRHERCMAKTLCGLNPFLDEFGILRVGRRLSRVHLEEEAKHPTLISYHGIIIDLLIRREHDRQLHAGAAQTLAALRENFWILRGRSTVKRIICMCRICRMAARLFQQRMGDLPAMRVNVGVDFVELLLIRGESSKHVSNKTYICLFTSMVVRAIHFELVPDLTIDSFLRALRWFVSRRSRLDIIQSDNFRTFHQRTKLGDCPTSSGIGTC